jgi:hypothetical protein
MRRIGCGSQIPQVTAPLDYVSDSRRRESFEVPKGGLSLRSSSSLKYGVSGDAGTRHQRQGLNTLEDCGERLGPGGRQLSCPPNSGSMGLHHLWSNHFLAATGLSMACMEAL